MLLPPAVRLMRGSRAAWASPTRSNAAATRRSAAMMSGRRSSSSEGTPTGTGGGIAASRCSRPRSPRPDSGPAAVRARAAPARATVDLAQHVAIGAGVGARFGHRLLVAVADAQPVLGEPEQRFRRAHDLRATIARCSPASMARNQLLATARRVDWRAIGKSACAARTAPPPRRCRSARDPRCRARARR